MKKISWVALLGLLPGMALADDAVADKGKLTLAVRRIGLEWSQTDVKNADVYEDSPVSALKADSQTFIKAVFDNGYVKNRVFLIRDWNTARIDFSGIIHCSWNMVKPN